MYGANKGFRTVYLNKPGSSSQIGRSKSSMNHARNIPGMHSAFSGSRKFRQTQLNSEFPNPTNQSHEASMDDS